MMQTKTISNDARGKIHLFEFGNKEYLLLETKKGYKRGGDYHQSRQHDILLQGEITFYYRKKRKEKILKMKEGDSIDFPPNIPHYLESTSDSLVLEWLEEDFEKKYDVVYRKIVEEGYK